MMRHTGDYLLGTLFLAAALILQFSQAQVHSVSKSSGDHRLAAAVDGSPEQSTSSTSLSALVKTPSPVVNTVLNNLPRGTRIVIGSLDMSGTRHQIRLRSRNDISSSGDSLAVVRFTAESLSQHRNPAAVHRLSSGVRSSQNRQFIHTAAYEPQLNESGLASAISHAVFTTTSEANSLPSTPINELPPRVFLMPHFGNTGTIHTPEECRAIGESQRARVYVNQRLPQSSSPDQMRSWSELLLSAVEVIAVPIVETWIGPVCDVDRNQKLSIVVTNLDQHGTQSSGRSPIFGCIRESDFCPESDFCGDIVYIDPNIFELPSAEVNALLTHEIVHAAICSMSQNATDEKSGNSLLKTPFFSTSATTPVPPWLNEAVAHFVELQCCDAVQTPHNAAQELVTENFQRRIDAFLAGPGCSPIVASDNVLNMEERRSGSRGAATLFLATLISTPRDLQTLLRNDDSLKDRIELLAQQPFADVFRNWTLKIASIQNDTESLSVEKIEPDFESKHCSLLGTAFQCFECADDIATLVLVSDESAQLQISVIEPAVRNPHIARSNP